MATTGSVDRLSWFEGLLQTPAPEPGAERPISERPPALNGDAELDRLEQALGRLVDSDNAAEERRSLLQSLQIVDDWYRSARDSGANVDNRSLSDLAYRLVEWKRGA